MKSKLAASYAVFYSPKYIGFFLLYFSFFLANAPLESAMPYLFQQAGMGAGAYGAFQSSAAFIFIFITPAISLLTVRRKYYSVCFFALFSSFLAAAVAAGIHISAAIVVAVCFFLLLGRKLFNFSISSKINFQVAPGLRGKYFAARDLFLFGGSSLGLILFGAVQKRGGIANGYGILSVFFILAALILLFLKKGGHITDTPAGTQKQPGRASAGSILLLLKNKRFAVFALSGVLTLFYQTTLLYLPLLGIRSGVPISSFLYLSGAFTIANAVLSVIISYYFDGKSKKAVYIFDIAIDMIPALLFLFGEGRMLFIAAYFVIMLKDFFAPISYAYKHDCFEEAEGIMAMGALSSIESAFSVIYPAVIGMLWERNYRLVYLLSSVAILAAAIICCVGLPNKTAAAEGTQ